MAFQLFKRLSLVLLFAGAVAARSQDLTLDQATTMALQHNRLVKVAQLEVTKTEHDTNAFKTNRLPDYQFNFIEGQMLTPITFTFPTGSFGVVPGLGPFPVSDAYITNHRRLFTIVEAQTNQPLTQLFRINLGIKAKKIDTLIAKEKLSQQEQAIASEVKKTYYNLVQAQSALTATDETITLLKEVNRNAANALQQQVILKSDMLDAEAGLAKAESEAVTLRNTAATLREKMNNLLARDLATEFTVTRAAEVKPWDMDLAATRAKALEQRPELRQARLKAQQADIDRRAKKAEYLPDLVFSLHYLSPFNFKFLPENMVAIGFQMHWEVFDWGRKRQEGLAKAAVTGEAIAAADETAAQIQVEVGNNYRKLQEAQAKLHVADLELGADREKVRVALDKYDTNSILMKDLLQAKASLAEKTYRYQESLLTFWNARADLEKSIGER